MLSPGFPNLKKLTFWSFLKISLKRKGFSKLRKSCVFLTSA